VRSYHTSDECVWKDTFPLLDKLSPLIHAVRRQRSGARFLGRALKAAAATTVPSTEGLRPSLVEIWEKMWAKCEEMRAVVVRRASAVAQHVSSLAPCCAGESGRVCGCYQVREEYQSDVGRR
jgi:hypothetical protein